MEKPVSRAPQSSTPQTTFVQADTTTFRELVRRLTGASDEDLRTATSPPSSAAAAEGGPQQLPAQKPIGVKKPAFKLHERRQYSRPKLEIIKPTYPFKPAHSPSKPDFETTELGLSPSKPASFPTGPTVLSPSAPSYVTSPLNTPSTSFSNLSITDQVTINRSDLNSEEEEKAIKERRFYLHPSPRSRPGNAEPELLTLFPLTSPRANES